MKQWEREEVKRVAALRGISVRPGGEGEAQPDPQDPDG